MYGVEWFNMMRAALKQKTQAQMDYEEYWRKANTEHTPFKEEKKMQTVVMDKTTDEWSKLIPAPEYHRIFKEKDWAALLKWANTEHSPFTSEYIQRYSRFNRIKEKLMTREEARKKIEGITTVSRNEWLDVLEALGLIKFEEEKKDSYKYATNVGDRTFLTFIYERLLNVHNESSNVDYMHTLKRFIDKWEENVVKDDYRYTGYKVAATFLEYKLIPDIDGLSCQVIGRLNKIQRTG